MSKLFCKLGIFILSFIVSNIAQALPSSWLMEQNDFNSYEEGKLERDVYRFYKSDSSQRIEIHIVSKNEQQNNEKLLKNLAKRYKCTLNESSTKKDEKRGEIQKVCIANKDETLLSKGGDENKALEQKAEVDQNQAQKDKDLKILNKEKSQDQVNGVVANTHNISSDKKLDQDADDENNNKYLLIVKQGGSFTLLIAGLNTTYEEIDALMRDLKNVQPQEN